MCLATRAGIAFDGGRDRCDRVVGAVGDVVERRDVGDAVGGQRQQQPAPSVGTPGRLPRADQLGDDEGGFLPVAQHGSVDEVGDRFGVERRVPAGDHDRVVLAPVDAVQRDAGEVERLEQVGVAELGGEADPEQVERLHRQVVLQRELRQAVLTHLHGEVRPHRERALGDHPVTLVEDFVQDREALVRLAHLVGVGVHQCPAHLGSSEVLAERVHFTAGVLHRLGHLGEQWLQPRVEGRHGVGCHGWASVINTAAVAKPGPSEPPAR